MQCDSLKTYSRCDRVSARNNNIATAEKKSAAPFFQVVANLTGFYPRSMKKVRPQPLQIVFSLPCGRILPIPRNLCLCGTNRGLSMIKHCDGGRVIGILFARMRITIYYFLSRNILCIYTLSCWTGLNNCLTFRANLLQVLRSIITRSVQYKKSACDLCREVQNKGCMCLPQLIIGMLYALTHSFRDTMHNNSLKLSSTLVHVCAVV